MLKPGLKALSLPTTSFGLENRRVMRTWFEAVKAGF
jgi:hypothetical protein